MNCVVAAIYCDDIRYEMGGKATLVGVYSGQLIVPKFPAKLSKLCIYATVVIPIEMVVQGPAYARVLRRDEVVSEVEMDLSSRQTNLKLHPSLDEPARFHRLVFAIVNSEVEFTGPTIYRFAAFINGQEIRGTALAVVAADAPVDTGKPKVLSSAIRQ